MALLVWYSVITIIQLYIDVWHQLCMMSYFCDMMSYDVVTSWEVHVDVTWQHKKFNVISLGPGGYGVTGLIFNYKNHSQLYIDVRHNIHVTWHHLKLWRHATLTSHDVTWLRNCMSSLWEHVGIGLILIIYWCMTSYMTSCGVDFLWRHVILWRHMTLWRHEKLWSHLSLMSQDITGTCIRVSRDMVFLVWYHSLNQNNVKCMASYLYDITSWDMLTSCDVDVT